MIHLSLSLWWWWWWWWCRQTCCYIYHIGGSSHSAVDAWKRVMGLLPDTWNCRLLMRWECRERFSHHPGLAIPTLITARAWRTWCMPGSLTSGFLWSRWWGKLSRHSGRMCNPEFYVSGKRTIASGNVSHPSLCRLLLLTTTIPATWHSADPFHKGFYEFIIQIL